MIPNALAKSGPEASYWAHLKSIHHTLQRLLTNGSLSKLDKLDEDRLRALISFFESAVPAQKKDQSHLVSSFAVGLRPGADYSSAMDWRKRIGTVRSFDEFRKSSKRSFEESVKRLTDAASKFLRASQENLIPLKIPRQEFEILKDIVHELLSEAEVTLHY